MRITIFLFIVGICVVSAKYVSYETQDSNALLRIKRSDDSNESSSQNSSENNDSDDSNDSEKKEVKQQELEDKMRRKDLERKEKERRKKEEEQRKLEEKQAKVQRKEEEKKEKEERKRLERLQKEKRKEEEKLKKEERKRQEKQRKELEKEKKEATKNKPVANDFLESEEENSVELSDVWKEHIYVKYGVTIASTKLEKQAALNRYLQEELGLNQNSTERERFQAVVQLIQTKLQTDPAARTALKNQLLSHINAVSIQKWRADIEKDLEELNNKTEILNNVSLTWVPVAKQQIEERRSFLQTISQFLSNILPNWVTGGQNVQNPINNVNSASVTNGPVNSVSNGPAILENNMNSASGTNIPSGISDASAAASQSDNGVATGSSISPSNTNENIPAQSASQIPTDGSGDGVQDNIKEITKPSSSSNVNSGNSEGSSGVNDDLSSTGVGVSINSESPSEENSEASVNSGNIESTNVIDKAPSVVNNVIPSENINEVSVGSATNEITSVPDAAVNTNASSINFDADGIIPASTTSNNDVTLTNNEVILPANGQATIAEDSASLGSSSNNDLSNVSNVANSAPTNTEDTSINSGNAVSSSSTDNTIIVNSDSASNNNVDVSIASVNDGIQTVSPDAVHSGINVASINNGGDLTSNVADTAGPQSTGSSQVNEVTSNGILSAEGDKEPAAADSGNALSSSATDEVLSKNPGVVTVEGSENISFDGSKLPVITVTVNIPSVNPDTVSIGSSDTTTVNNVGNPSSSVNTDATPTNNGENPTSIVADNVVVPTPIVISAAGNEVASDNSANVYSPSIVDGALSQNSGGVTSEGTEGIAIDSSNLPSTTVSDTSVNPDMISVGNSDTTSTINVGNPSSSVNLDPVSSGNSDAAPTINDENQTSIVADNVVDSTTIVVSADGNEAASDNSANVNSPSIVDGALSQNSGGVTSEGTEGIAIDSSNLPSTTVSDTATSVNPDTISAGSSDTTSTNNVGNPSSSVNLDPTSSGNSDAAPTINGENPTSIVADNLVIATPIVISADGNEVVSDTSVNVNLPSIADGDSTQNPGEETSKGTEGISIDSSNLPSTTVTDTATSVHPDTISVGSSDATTTNNVGNPSSSANLDPVSSGNSDAAQTVTDTTASINPDIVPVESSDTTSPNNVGNPSLSVNLDTASSGNSDAAPTINGENLTSIVADKVVVVTPIMISAEASPDNSANVISPSIANGASSQNLGEVTSEGISIDSSNLPSTTVTDNTASINPDIVSVGSGDTTPVNNVGNPSLSVTHDVKPPSSDVVYAEGNAVDNSANNASISETDNASDATSSNDNVGVPPASVDIVLSTSVTESSSSTDSGLASSTNSNTPSVTNDNVVSSDVTDNNSPPNTNEVSPEVDEPTSSVNVVSSNGIDNVDVAPVKTDEIVPSENTSPTFSVGINDPTIGNSNIDIVNTSEAATVGLPDTVSDPNVNIDPSAINVDTTIAPEIINSVQIQDKGIDAQTVSVVTKNPVDSENENEVVTTVSDVISNVNTISTSAAETSAPSEAPQVPTSESTVVDAVRPVELPKPVVVIDGIKLPNEPGASVVEILPQ